MVEDILSKIGEYMFSSDVDKKTVQELFLSDEYLKVQYDEKFVQELINIFADYYADCLVRLPMYYELKIEEIELICNIVRK